MDLASDLWKVKCATVYVAIQIKAILAALFNNNNIVVACFAVYYNTVNSCLVDTPIKWTVTKSPPKTKYKRLTEINSRYYGLSLKRTLTWGPYSVCHEGS